MSHNLLALPDLELALSRWLRADQDVIDLAGDRVYTEIPAAPKVWPMLRVFRIGGGPDTWPYWLERAELQIDSWGGSKREAWKLIEAAMRALASLQLPHVWQALDPELQALGVLSRVTFLGLIYLPDVDVPSESGRARPRYLVNATVTAHAQGGLPAP